MARSRTTLRSSSPSETERVLRCASSPSSPLASSPLGPHCRPPARCRLPAVLSRTLFAGFAISQSKDQPVDPLLPANAKLQVLTRARSFGLSRNSAAEAWTEAGRIISYGLYVYHLLFLTLTQTLHASPLLQHLSALLLTVAAASLSYAGIEKPFLRLKQRFTHVRSRP